MYYQTLPGGSSFFYSLAMITTLLTFNGNRSEQLNLAQLLPNCATALGKDPSNKNLRHNQGRNHGRRRGQGALGPPGF